MTKEIVHKRSIRSFVMRQGRMTLSQRRALAQIWPLYCLQAQEDSLLQWQEIFQRYAPIILEIGFGMGDPLVAMAKEYPEKNFVGVEVHLPGVGACLAKAHAAGLTNLRIFAQDAIQVLNQVPAASLSKVLLLFPDPWPKRRHHKRRIVQKDFVITVAQKLKPGGIFHLATDWQPYAEHMLAVLEACPLLQNVYGAGQFAQTATSRPLTKFEKRGVKLGHTIHDLIYSALP